MARRDRERRREKGVEEEREGDRQRGIAREREWMFFYSSSMRGREIERDGVREREEERELSYSGYILSSHLSLQWANSLAKLHLPRGATGAFNMHSIH